MSQTLPCGEPVDARFRAAGRAMSTDHQALAQSARFLERCSRLARVGAWEWQADIEQLVLSDSARRLLGLPDGQVPTLPALLQRFGADGAAMLGAALRCADGQGQHWDVELPCDAGLLGRRVMRVVGGPDEDGQGVGRRVGVVMLDVTEQACVRAELERTLEWLALATHSGGVGLWELDLRGVTPPAWDDAMWRLHGEPPRSRLSLAEWRRRLHPQDQRHVFMALRAALRSAPVLDVEWRVCWPDGSTHVLHGSGRVQRDASGRPLRLSGACWDVSEARRLQHQLAEQHELLTVTLQSIADAVLTTDALGLVATMNPVAERLTGWRCGDARGRPSSEVFSVQRDEGSEPLPDPVKTCLATGLLSRLPPGAVLRSRDGELRAVDDSVAPIRDTAGRVLGAVLVFRDVTQQRRQWDEIRWQASHDGLTGLVNRAEFQQRLARTFERAVRDGSQHVLLAFDLDHFKLVNDCCGHAAGDEVLCAVARRLEAGVRSRDTVARLGGDEFAAILENCSLDEAEQVAQALCVALDDYRFVQGEQRLRIGVSIGVAPLDARWPDAEAALRQADACCLIAKEQGRNRVHLRVPDDATLHAHQSQHQWALRLQQALDEDRFELDLQRLMPAQAGADDGRLRGELLLRLRERDGSRVLPEAFMATAERFQLAPRLDLWRLRQAVALLQRDGAGAIAGLSVNVSAPTLLDVHFHDEARALLQGLGPQRASALCMEIGEAAVVSHPGDAARFIAQMRTLGVRLAVDDFAACASSYGHLKALPVHVLKIGSPFVPRLLADPLSEVAVRSFVDVARALGLATVAQGVETPEVLQVLARLGVNQVQGDALHRPQPLAAVLAQMLVELPGKVAAG